MTNCTCLPLPDGHNDACPQHGIDAMADRVQAGVGKSMIIELWGNLISAHLASEPGARAKVTSA